MTSQEKKAYLLRYKHAKANEKSITEEMTRLRLDTMLPSRNDDGMPHSTNKSDLSSYAARYDQLYEKLMRAFRTRIEIEDDIVDRLEQMENESYCALLRYRYICLMDWDTIGAMMDYSGEYVRHMHGNALQAFPLD